MKPTLDALILQAAKTLVQSKGISLPEPFEYDLMVSKDTSQGDFACNAAFKLARALKCSPKQTAAELLAILNASKPPVVRSLEIGGAGFINFYLSRISLNEIIQQIRTLDEKYGQSSAGQGKKVVVEFVSANPTGPLTIAHGRQAIIGDVLIRVLQAAGYHAHAEYYLNDAGRQMNLLGQSLWTRYRQALGMNAELPEDGYKGQYLSEIAAKLVGEKGKTLLADEKSGIEACRMYAQNEIMQGILRDLKEVGVGFDHYFSERTLYEKGEVEKVFRVLKDRGFTYEQDGALWFRSTAFGDDKDRVLKKSSGELTYISPDIAYHQNKFSRGFEWIVDLMGPDHHGYVTRLKAACEALGYDPKKVDVRIVQLTTLYRQGAPVRMSTRAGEFVTLRELIDEVGVDAARIFFVMRRVESPLDFDLDLAKQKSQENPVYYLQYAHARISSIFRHAQIPMAGKPSLERLNSEEENDLIKRLYEFPEVVANAALMLEPYRVVDYLRDTAASFHKFYSAHRVLTEDQELTQARLALVDAARIVIRNGLQILGASQPQSM